MAAAIFVSAASARAQTPDPADVAEGQNIFAQKGGCQTCHGWAGDGRKMDSQMPDGANLRETVLNRQEVVATIKCGRPGRDMPAFDKFAYSDGRCSGLKLPDLAARGWTLFEPPATLQPREVEMVADFLFAKIVGKGPMNRAKCLELFGSDVEVCSEFDK